MSDIKAFEFKPYTCGMTTSFERDKLEVLKNIDKNIAMLGTIVQDLWREDNLGRLTRFNSFVTPEKLPDDAIGRLNGFRDGTKENSDHGVSKDNE